MLDRRIGFDWIDYSASKVGMTVGVVTGTGVGGDAQGDKVTLGSVEAILGSAPDDVLAGDGFDNILSGGAGHDTPGGRAGNDTLIGGAVADTLDGGTCIDLMNGGLHNDICTDTMVSSFNIALAANVENRSLTGTDDLIGTGSAAANVLTANYVLYGLQGNYSLYGGAGNDTPGVGLGVDSIAGGFGDATY